MTIILVTQLTREVLEMIRHFQLEMRIPFQMDAMLMVICSSRQGLFLSVREVRAWKYEIQVQVMTASIKMGTPIVAYDMLTYLGIDMKERIAPGNLLTRRNKGASDEMYFPGKKPENRSFITTGCQSITSPIGP